MPRSRSPAVSGSLVRRNRTKPLDDALRGGRRSLLVATNLDRREREADPVLVEALFDTGEGLSPDDELLARFGRHLHADLDAVIAEPWASSGSAVGMWPGS
jgi:hypothetical protein